MCVDSRRIQLTRKGIVIYVERLSFVETFLLLAAPSSLSVFAVSFFFCFEFYCLHVTFHIIFLKHLRYNLLSLNISINTAPCRHIHNGARAFIVPPKKEMKRNTFSFAPLLLTQCEMVLWEHTQHQASKQASVRASEQVISNHIKGNMSSVHISNVCTLHRFPFPRENIRHFKYPRSNIHLHFARFLFLFSSSHENHFLVFEILYRLSVLRRSLIKNSLQDRKIFRRI